MTYMDKVLARLDLPGLIMLIAGAVLAYASGKIAGKFSPQKMETLNLIIKAAGGVLVLIGALILLDFIG